MKKQQVPKFYPREWYRAPPMPNGELSDPDSGSVAAAIRLVGAAEIKEALRRHNVRFAIQYYPHDSPTWVTSERLYDTWKAELQPRLLPPKVATTRIYLDDYPDGYCYVASEWHLPDGQVVILFETYH